MREGSKTFKYLGIALFLLTALLLIFGMGIWYVSTSLLLYVIFAHSYFEIREPYWKYKFWILAFLYFLFWFAFLFELWRIGTFGIGCIFFNFIFFQLRYRDKNTFLNPEWYTTADITKGSNYCYALIFSAVLLVLYSIIV